MGWRDGWSKEAIIEGMTALKGDFDAMAADLRKKPKLDDVDTVVLDMCVEQSEKIDKQIGNVSCPAYSPNAVASLRAMDEVKRVCEMGAGMITAFAKSFGDSNQSYWKEAQKTADTLKQLAKKAENLEPVIYPFSS